MFLSLLHQAGFLVILQGAGMDGGRQAFEHGLAGQAFEGGMELLELVEVLKDFLRNGVHDVVRHLG